MSEPKSRGFVDLYEEPSEHEHEWQPRKYYYCECGEIAPSIQEMWVRITALEGVVKAVKEWDIVYIEDLKSFLFNEGKYNAATWVYNMMKALEEM